MAGNFVQQATTTKFAFVSLRDAHRKNVWGNGSGGMTEMRSVQLPAELCGDVEKKFAHAFGSLDELLTCVLRDLVRDDARAADEAEQKLVEERLRELGYL